MIRNKYYRAWDIDPQDFYKAKTQEDKLIFILQFALLAPSSHNTQPWQFSIEQNTIHVYVDPSRRLKYSDPTGRLTFIALGAVAENIAIAADYYGFVARYEENDKENGPDYAFSLHLELSDTKIYPQEFLRAILNRASYRKQYKKEKVSQDIFQLLRNIEEDDVSFVFFSAEADKKRLAEIAGVGMKEKMSSKNFRRELTHWLRNNLSGKPDGMPGFGHGLSLFVSIIAPYIVRNIDVSNKEREKIIRKVQGFPAVCVITSSKDTPHDWVLVGSLLERALITLTARGMSASIIAAPIESNTARERLRSMIHTDSLPQIVFGFGAPASSVPHSPRRGVSAIHKKAI